MMKSIRWFLLYRRGLVEQQGKGTEKGWFFSIVLVVSFACMPVSALATPLISEVLYDDEGSDDAAVFVEISGASGTDLEGFFLQGVNGNGGALGPLLALRGTIPPDGIFVLADVTGSGFSKWQQVADQFLNFDFQNGPDSILLLEGTVVRDALGYGVFDSGEVFAGEGTPAVDPPAGWSVSRRWADWDTQDNGTDFVGLEEPSPGTAFWLPVPEPGSGLLAGVALGALAWWRRRKGC